MEILELLEIWGLELVQMILFAKIICFQRIKWQKKQIQKVILSIGMFFVAAAFIKINVIILLMISIFLFFILLDGKKWHCFLVFWTAYWMVSKINYISAVLLSFCSSIEAVLRNNIVIGFLFPGDSVDSEKSCYEYFQNYPENIVRSICGILIIILLGFVVKYWQDFIRSLPDSFYGLSALGGSFFFFCINPAMRFGKQVSSKALQNIIVLGSVFSELLFYMILLALFAVNSKCNNYQKENKFKEFMLQASKEYCREILENGKEIRKFRHDMKHHITIMKYFLYEKKYQKLLEYLVTIDEELERVLYIHKATGNEILDAVLAKYVQRNPQIFFQVEGEISASNITDYDLCVIFSNAIVNAVEACNRLKEKEKIIEIYLKKTGNNIIFVIKNPLEWKVDINRLGDMTTKEDKMKHGYGISRIREIAEKYDGSVDFQIEEQKFQIAVILTEITVCYKK